MRKHKPHCKAMAAEDWKEEEMLEEDNSNEDDGYLP